MSGRWLQTISYHAQKMIWIQITSNAHIPRGAKEKQCFQSTKVSTGFKSANSLFYRAELWPLRASPPALVLTCTPTLIRGMRRHVWLEASSHKGVGMPRCCCKPVVMFSVQYWAWCLTGSQGGKRWKFQFANPLRRFRNRQDVTLFLLCLTLYFSSRMPLNYILYAVVVVVVSKSLTCNLLCATRRN